jgi:hypothetical protein
LNSKAEPELIPTWNYTITIERYYLILVGFEHYAVDGLLSIIALHACDVLISVQLEFEDVSAKHL